MMKIPDTFQDITPTWLTEVLRAKGTITKAGISSIETESIDETQGAASQIVRLHLTYDRNEPKAPTSLVAKFSSSNPAHRAQLHALKLYEREVRFYQQVAPGMSVRTPECFFSDIDLQSGQSLLLLEDLSAARNPGKFDVCSPVEIELVMNQLTTLHAAWWESPRLNDIDWLPQPDLQRLQATYQARWTPFLERIGHTLPAPMLEVGRQFGQVMITWGTYLRSSPRTLVHGDCQPANMYFIENSTGEPSVVLGDWQLAVLSRGARDVANFLSRSVSPEVRKVQEMSWLEMYHAVLMEKGVKNYAFDECLRDYRLTLLVGLHIVVFLIGGGNLSPEAEARFCDVIVPRYCAAIQDLDVSELLSDASLSA